VVLLDSGGHTTTNFIAPLFKSGTTFVPDDDGGYIGFGAGTVDPSVLAGPSSPPYNIANGLTVYRFLWRNVCADACDGQFDDDLNFEAVLIDRGHGDFDLDFNYGDIDGTQGPVPSDSVGGFLLAANAATFSDFQSPGPDYCFRSGVAAVCGSTSTTVPEPDTVALIVTGFGMLSVAALRSRRFVPRRLRA